MAAFPLIPNVLMDYTVNADERILTVVIVSWGALHFSRPISQRRPKLYVGL
jgi:hypothetical protein